MARVGWGRSSTPARESGSTHREDNLLGHDIIAHGGLAELAFPLAGSTGEKVATIHMPVLNFARGGNPESLFQASVCFILLGHGIRFRFPQSGMGASQSFGKYG
ncbi:hypothetical protein [Tuwongella immobilis]|nr:hypothetical protein [Tuwongella immobilis]